MKKAVILLGGPGSGKGTQAKILAEKYGYVHFSAGQMLRNLIKTGAADPQDKALIKAIEKGEMVPNELVYKYAFPVLQKHFAAGEKVVLDGAVRNLDQAKRYRDFLDAAGVGDDVAVIEIALTDKESFDRLTRRRMCSACGEIIPFLTETKDIRVCPKCGGKLEVRADDEPAVIKNRIGEQGNAALRPIADYYAEMEILKKVDGMKDIDGVAKAIEKVLREE